MSPTRKKHNLDSSFLSVVIPVYNAEQFLKKAVESALLQPETAEVILIEDASPDKSYSVCQFLAKRYDNVHLFKHEGHVNKGAGASRNAGIEKAKYDYIAFLDADDFFLEDRFLKTKKVLQSHQEADGVYEAIGVHFDSERSKKRWTKHKGGSTLTTIEDNINPCELFWHQSPIGRKGYTHLDGFTVKKAALLDIDLFEPELRLHQDSNLFMRLAMDCRLFPGELKRPVAMRRVHENNRITQKRSIGEEVKTFKKMLRSTHQWALENGYDAEAKELKKTIRYSLLKKINGSEYNDSITNLRYFFFAIKKDPSLILEPTFYKYLFKFILRYILIKLKLY